MMDVELGFERTASVVSVTELLKEFPELPPRVLVTLAIVALLSRSVTPFKRCECGCGEPIHGKEKSAGTACRKRLQRERDALRAGSPKQFNIVLQSEIPVPIPVIPVPLAVSRFVSSHTGQSHQPELIAHVPLSACHDLSLPVTGEL